MNQLGIVIENVKGVVDNIIGTSVLGRINESINGRVPVGSGSTDNSRDIIGRVGTAGLRTRESNTMKDITRIHPRDPRGIPLIRKARSLSIPVPNWGRQNGGNSGCSEDKDNEIHVEAHVRKYLL